MIHNDTQPVLNDNFFAFVTQHLGEDAMRLRLKKWPEMNFSLDLAITQVEARNRNLDKKIPRWAENSRVVFPSLLATEQCSSQATAAYKQQLVVGNSLCDLTGGLGIDLYFMAQNVQKATYIEQSELYCHVAQHNFATLGASHIEVINNDCNSFIDSDIRHFDTIYIDPARRGKSQERIFAVADCEPNVLAMLPTLLKRCKRLIIKLSPMVDLTQLRSEIAVPCHIYVVSHRNECKEILVVIDSPTSATEFANSSITTCVLIGNDCVRECNFNLDNEEKAPYSIAPNVGNYLYEPDTALLKAGVFKSICTQYNVCKLHKSSHLYTSYDEVSDFPGRAFRITEVVPFSSSICKTFAKQYPACNITTRNFPLSAVELRKKFKVKDGGAVYLFATTLADNSTALVMCDKL